jgi:hypothetical protein
MGERPLENSPFMKSRLEPLEEAQENMSESDSAHLLDPGLQNPNELNESIPVLLEHSPFASKPHPESIVSPCSHPLGHQTKKEASA